MLATIKILYGCNALFAIGIRKSEDFSNFNRLDLALPNAQSYFCCCCSNKRTTLFGVNQIFITTNTDIVSQTGVCK